MSITQYEEEGKQYWRVYVHIRSTTDRRKRFQKSVFNLKTESEARREEKRLIRELSRQAQKHDGLGLSWKNIVDLWGIELKAGYVSRCTEKSANEYISTVRKWTNPWNHLPAAQLTRRDGRKLMDCLDKSDTKASYQKKVKNIVNKVYEWGIEYGYIIGNNVSPLKGFVIDKKEEKVPDILSLEEIKRFLTAAQAVDHHWYPIWVFAILTGMRSGELHALTWDQIDLDKNTILVDRSYDANSRKIGPTKARYWRTIPINESLKKLIIDLKKESKLMEPEHVLPRSKDWNNGDQAVPLKNFLKSIKMKPIKFHALRACFATQMLSNGVPAPIVMKVGGWKKSATMDIYLRLAGVDTQGATDCLGFVPNEIAFGDNVVAINDFSKNQ